MCMRRSDQLCLSTCQRHLKRPFFERVVLPIKTDSGSFLVKRHLACEKASLFLFIRSEKNVDKRKGSLRFTTP